MTSRRSSVPPAVVRVFLKIMPPCYSARTISLVCLVYSTLRSFLTSRRLVTVSLSQCVACHYMLAPHLCHATLRYAISRFQLTRSAAAND
ncbi:hypothetical protein J6590_036300 [Homalodisca vitripennis]|nr:hypothetical protein J6590_036300 [Homalodisca vitripennis]